jgi:hypothetical protein
MSNCTQAGITDAAFAHLRGIYKLEMSLCNQESITDAAFEHLRGIHALDMSGCWHITEAAVARLVLNGVKNITFCQYREDLSAAARQLGVRVFINLTV